MRDIMNMAINDNELDIVAGGVAKSVNNYSIQHAIARYVQGPSNNASKKSGTKTRRTFRIVKNTVMSGTRPRLILL